MRSNKSCQKRKTRWTEKPVDDQYNLPWDSKKNSTHQHFVVGVEDTPNPRVKTTQVMSPSTTVCKSNWNSSRRRTTAVPGPATIQFVRAANQMIGIKAAAFFHLGQLRGSLMSSEGWGISLMSEFLLCLNWLVSWISYEILLCVPSTSCSVPSVASSSFKDRNLNASSIESSLLLRENRFAEFEEPEFGQVGKFKYSSQISRQLLSSSQSTT